MRKRFVTVVLAGALIAGTAMVGTASAAESTAGQVVHTLAPTDLYGPYGIDIYPSELDCVYAGEYFRLLGFIVTWACLPYDGSHWELYGYYDHPLGF